jgi:hypothetical protein
VNAAGAISFDVGITGIIFGTELKIAEQQITNAAVRAIAAVSEADVTVEKCDHDHSNHDHSHHHHEH